MTEKVKVVIKIPKYYLTHPQDYSCLAECVRRGTPLPKGHGRLGDLDELKKEMQNYHDDCAKTSEYTRLGFETDIAAVEDANTIIEADKAEGKKIKLDLVS